MLTALHLGNFKAFAETQNIPIRPLTLIFGANSSGKSSLIHSLVLAHHAIKTGEIDVHRTTIGGDSVDLGGFNQYVHQRDIKRHVGWAVTIPKDTFTKRLNELFPVIKDFTVGVSVSLTQRSKALTELIDIFIADILKKGAKANEEEIKKSISKAFGEFTPKEAIELFLKISEKKDDEFREQTLKKLSLDSNFLTYIEQTAIEGKVHIDSFKIEANKKTILSMSYRPEGHLQLDIIDNEHEALIYIIKSVILSMTTTEKVDESDFACATEAINDLVPEISFSIGKFFPEKLRGEKTDKEQLSQQAIIPIGKGSRQEDIKNAFKSFFSGIIKDIVLGCSEIAEQEIGYLSYLGPLRSYPPRHIAFSQYHDPNWYAGGGYAWDVVRSNLETRSKVNEWLGNAEKLSTPYELRIRNLLTIEEIENRWPQLTANFLDEMYKKNEDHSDNPFLWAEEFVQGLPYNLKVLEPLMSDVQDLSLYDKRTNTLVSHRDVGIGISQVLPVLVSAYASKNKIVAIEQPEIHLHPALQAELGDVFIESALGENKNAFILETHSEHLVLRVMRRIRETCLGVLPEGCTPIRPQDVSILYVEPDGSRSIVREMPLNDKGGLVKAWPGGFFEEGLREVLP